MCSLRSACQTTATNAAMASCLKGTLQIRHGHVTWTCDMDAGLNCDFWGLDREGYLVRYTKNGTVGEACDDLKSQLPKFLWHVFIKRRQADAYENDKQLAKQEESNECVLQMDFAENFTATFQDEIQSGHWWQRQVTLYTVMIWHCESTKSILIVSDVREHEKRAVVSYTAAILNKIVTEMPEVATVKVWTDGPSSQFKSKYIFALLLRLSRKFGLGIIWKFFAISHGKGPNDALGGNAKCQWRPEGLQCPGSNAWIGAPPPPVW